MKNDLSNPNFADFVHKFPEISLPITLTQEAQFAFSQQNKPLHPVQIQHFIGDIGDEEISEAIPCLRIPDTKDIVALIYWTAGLLSYEYHLATYTNKGELIDDKVIAGLKSNSEFMLERVATIDPDWIIYVVEGESKASDPLSINTHSEEMTLELQPNGLIIKTN